MRMDPEHRRLRRRVTTRFALRMPLTHKALARATGLTPGQVSYCLDQAGISTAALRRGEDPRITRMIRHQRKQLAKMIATCDRLRRIA